MNKIKRCRGTPLKNTEATINRAFQYWLQSKGLRETAAFFNIPPTTLSYNFRRLYGKNYKSLKNNHGILSIIQEHISNPRLSRSQRAAIERWKTAQLKNILLNDLANKDTRLLTSREEQQLTLSETSHSSHDWRDIL